MPFQYHARQTDVLQQFKKGDRETFQFSLVDPMSGFESPIRLQNSLKALFKKKEIFFLFWGMDGLSVRQKDYLGSWKSFLIFLWKKFWAMAEFRRMSGFLQSISATLLNVWYANMWFVTWGFAGFRIGKLSRLQEQSCGVDPSGSARGNQVR